MKNLSALQVSFQHLNQLIGEVIVLAQNAGQNPNDVLRGLVVSLDEVAKHLGEAPLSSAWQSSSTQAFRIDLATPFDPLLTHLAQQFTLDTLDVFILLVCLAPDLDRRYERLYAYLQDDVSQRRPTVNLVMNLLGSTEEGRFAVWHRLQPGMPLRDYHLLSINAPSDRLDAGALSHILRADARLVAFLLGSATPDERIRAALLPIPDPIVTLPDEQYAALDAAFALNPIVYMQGRGDHGQIETAAALCKPYGLSLLGFDAGRLKQLDTPLLEAFQIILREAYLNDSALFIDDWQALLDERQQPPADIWRALYGYKNPVFLRGEDEWAAHDVPRTRRVLRVSFEVPGYNNRRLAWESFAAATQITIEPALLDEVTGKFRVTRSQIGRAVHTALDVAISRGSQQVERADVYAGIQAHINIRLGHLARRVVPKVDWSDLVLPDEHLTQLREIIARARFAHIVHEEWGFGETIRGSYGVSALFSGESGTGKTLSAQVIARELGLPMYRIDLSAVVSKYVGETEKNLNVIFNEARSSNAILFFDEADAIFGKRSEVKDAHDRYANIEVAYLLQQVEEYEGVAILATNMRQNLDEAFTRRLDFLIDFPFPEAADRERLWAVHFPARAPLDQAVSMAELGKRYPLAGGNIRNAALAAAYLAAADGGVITMQHIQTAIRREHQKMGRLLEGGS